MVDPETFRICVDGRLGESWAGELRATSVSVREEEGGRCTTTLVTGPVDQAALIGVIVHLNALGLPLASVECMPVSDASRTGGARKHRPS